MEQILSFWFSLHMFPSLVNNTVLFVVVDQIYTTDFLSIPYAAKMPFSNPVIRGLVPLGSKVF